MMSGWLEIILSYTFTIDHRAGVLNMLPDALSRLYPAAMQVSAKEASVLHQSQADPQRQPLPESERPTAIANSHLQGHFGVRATMSSLIRRQIWWPNMRSDVENALKACVPCQRFTIWKHGYTPLTPITASDPMEHIAIDTALSFPTSATGMNILLVVVCIFTRFVFLRALPDKSAASVAAALFNIFADFGFPKVIQSDNGTEFVNRLMQTMTENCGIDHRLITAYHPRANGIAERNVGTSTRAIKKLLDQEGEEWDRFVPAVQLFMNLKVADIHHSSPFAVMFSRSPNDFLNFSAQPDATPATYDEVRQRLIWSQEILFPAIRDAHSSHAAAAIASYARRHRILKSDPFPPGSVVMVRDPVRQNKMQPTYTGPFKVIRRTKGGSYELSDLQGAPAARAVAPSMMKPVIADPVLDADSYVVETILAHRDTPSQRLYHVRWKGFGPEHDSWEPATTLDAATAIDDYWSKSTPSETAAPSAPSPETSSSPSRTLGGSDVVNCPPSGTRRSSRAPCSRPPEPFFVTE